MSVAVLLAAFASAATSALLSAALLGSIALTMVWLIVHAWPSMPARVLP